MSATEFEFTRGFLPTNDPLQQLPTAFAAWESFSAELPKLLAADAVKDKLEALPPFTTDQLTSLAEHQRAMLILSFIGHAYVLGGNQPEPQIPAILAKPWHAVASHLGRPPVLSYASYAMHNWRRIEPEGPVATGNIELLQNFLGGIDEEWFILIHVEIEALAAPAINALIPTINAANQDNRPELHKQLAIIATALDNMCTSLERMPEHCDPYIYFNRVRPYIHGWKDNQTLPNGLLYEGVEAYQGKAQFFRGETGAQSGIIPSFDAIFNVQHEDDPLRVYLTEMRDYMPTTHREFLHHLEQTSQLRQYIIEHSQSAPDLQDLFNHCIDRIVHFRNTHLNYAANYIHKQSQTCPANPNSTGTGGTPFMRYLRKHLEETKRSQVM